MGLILDDRLRILHSRQWTIHSDHAIIFVVEQSSDGACMSDQQPQESIQGN